jgi:hypothetical protein
MRQQFGFEYQQTQNGQRLLQRRTVAPPGQGTYCREPPPANPQRAGHYAGLHGEDRPFQSDDLDSTYTQLPARITPRSAVRYRPTQHQQAKPRRRFHWLVWVGVAMLVMLAGWIALSALGNWWQTTQDDWHFGRPRTFQVDAVVGHNNDSASNPSHFLAINLNRHVLLIELPAGDPSKARIYNGPLLLGQGQDLTPVTLSFQDVNGDGKPDMLVWVADAHFVFLNDGGGFRPARPGEAGSS